MDAAFLAKLLVSAAMQATSKIIEENGVAHSFRREMMLALVEAARFPHMTPSFLKEVAELYHKLLTAAEEEFEKRSHFVSSASAETRTTLADGAL